MPLVATGQQGLVMTLIPLILGSIAIPLIALFNAGLGREIIKPTWNDTTHNKYFTKVNKNQICEFPFF